MATVKCLRRECDCSGRTRRFGDCTRTGTCRRFSAARRFRSGGVSVFHDNLACVRNRIEVNVTAINLGFELDVALCDFYLGPVSLHPDRKRVVILRNVIRNGVLEFERLGVCCTAVLRLNFGGIAFLDVHGDKAHRSHPNVLVVFLCPLQCAFDSAEIGRGVGGVAVGLALETMREECGPTVALDDFLHSAGKVARALDLAFGTGHGSGSLSPVAGTVLAHFISHALPAAVADTAYDVVAFYSTFIRNVAVRVSSCCCRGYCYGLQFRDRCQPYPGNRSSWGSSCRLG